VRNPKSEKEWSLQRSCQTTKDDAIEAGGIKTPKGERKRERLPKQNPEENLLWRQSFRARKEVYHLTVKFRIGKEKRRNWEEIGIKIRTASGRPSKFAEKKGAKKISGQGARGE